MGLISWFHLHTHLSYTNLLLYINVWECTHKFQQYSQVHTRRHTSTTLHANSSLTQTQNQDIRKKRREERWIPWEFQGWCSGVCLKEAYQCRTPKLSAGLTIKTAIVQCTSRKEGFAPILVKKGTFPSQKTIMDRWLPNSLLLRILFQATRCPELETEKVWIRVISRHIDDRQRPLVTITGELEEKKVWNWEAIFLNFLFLLFLFPSTCTQDQLVLRNWCLWANFFRLHSCKFYWVSCKC